MNFDVPPATKTNLIFLLCKYNQLRPFYFKSMKSLGKGFPLFHAFKKVDEICNFLEPTTLPKQGKICIYVVHRTFMNFTDLLS
jgi:hypothetical protein